MDAKKLLPNKKVCERYGVCDMTRRRWRQNPALNFPRPVRINNREYTYESELDEFDERQRVADAGADG